MLSPLQLPVLVALLSLAPVVCFPATFLLELYAGAVLLYWQALLATLFAKFVAAALVYAVTRSSLQPLVHGCLANYRRYETLQQGAAQGGWKFVLLARLSPLPNFVVNYALWQVPLREYLWPTIGAFPVLLQTLLIGHVLPTLAVPPSATVPAVGHYVGVLLSLLVCTVVLRKVRSVCYSLSGLEILPDTSAEGPIQQLLRERDRGKRQLHEDGDALLELQERT